jgi:hypothetical protein
VTRWLCIIGHWWRQVFRRAEMEDDLSDELQFYLDHEIERNVAAGMPRDEAERSARRAFGSMLRVKDACRDVWRWDA